MIVKVLLLQELGDNIFPRGQCDKEGFEVSFVCPNKNKFVVA